MTIINGLVRVAVRLAALLFLCAAPSVSAVSLYWDTNGTGTSGSGAATGTWGTSVFWSTDSTGANIGSPVLTATTTGVDDLFFSAGTTGSGGTVTVNTSRTARKLTFEEGAITLSGGTLITLAGGGGLTVDTLAGDAIVSTALTLNGANTFNVGASRTLTLNTGAFTRGTRATLNVQGAGTLTSTMTGFAANANNIVGPWASFGTGAATTFAKFSGANIAALGYTGGADGLSVAAATSVVTGAGNLNYTLSAAGTLGTSANINTLRYTGAAGTLATATAFTTRGIMNAGTGLLTFSGAVTAGAAGNETVINTATANITFNGVFTGTINKVGTGTMTLGTAANTGTTIPNITVNEGVLVANSSSGDTFTSTTINSGGTLRWGAGGKFNNNATITVNAGGTLDIVSYNDLIAAVAGVGTITGTSGTLQLGNNNVISFAGLLSGGMNLQIRSGGDVTLPSLNTYTGTTTIGNGGTAGILRINSIGNVSGAASAVGIPASAANGLIKMGDAAATGTLVYTGTGHSTDRTIQIGVNSTTPANTDIGGATIQADGAGNAALTFSAATFNTQTTAASGVGANRILTLQGTSTGDNTISGIIRDNVVTTPATGTATIGLAKSQAGTWILSAANTYSGATTINAGTLTLNNNLALQNSALVTTGAGTLALASGITTPTLGGLSGASGDLATIISSGYSLVTALTLNPNSGTVTYGGVIADGTAGMTLTKSGAGTQILSGANTYSGATTISGGTLLVVVGGDCANSAVTVNSTPGCTLGVSVNDNTKQWSCASLTSAGASATLAFGFTTTPSPTLPPLNVTGDLTFTGVPAITVDPANLVSGQSYPLMTCGGTAPSGTPTVTIGQGLTGTTSWTGNTLYLNVLGTSTLPLTWAVSGSGTWDINTTANWKDNTGAFDKYWDGFIALGDPVVFSDTDLSADTTVTLNTVVKPSSVTINNSSWNYILSGSGAITGPSGLTKSGSGMLTLSGAHTYSGGLKMTAGTVTLGNGSATGTGTISFDTAGAVNASVLASVAITITNPIIIASGSAGANTLGCSGNVAVTYNGGITANNNLTISNGGTATLASSGIISGNGGVITAGSAAGTTTIGGANTYTGGFTLGGASTIVPTKSSTGTDGDPTDGPFGAGTTPMILSTGTMRATTGGDITIKNVLTLAGNLTVPTVASEMSLILSGPATLTGTRTFTANVGATVAAKSLTFSGAIGEDGGSFGITKDGTGRMVLTGANTYSGTTTISAGTLQLGDGTSGKDGTIDNSMSVVNNGTLVFNRFGSLGYNGVISGSGAVTKNGAGTQTLSSENSYSGVTTISAGTLRITHASALGNITGGTTQSGASELAIDGTGSAVIVGAEALTINGGGINNAGALRNIIGDNTYGGIVTLAAQSRINSDSGTLTLDNATAVTGTAKNLVVGGAGNITISGAIATTTGFVSKDGAGTLTLSGANTYSGATVINAGTLKLGASDVLPDTTAVYLTAATLDADTADTADTAGTLAVTNATINLGTGAALAFADSTSKPWAGTLNINITGTLGGTSLRFGTSAAALTADQLSRIIVNGNGVKLDADGYLVEVAASTYNWDNDGETVGFGMATGTWDAPTTGGTSQGWSIDPTGATLPGDVTTTWSDSVSFGTGSAGLAAGTITVNGTVAAKNLIFGSASGAITLTGGTILLASSSPTITVNNSVNTINTTLSGALTGLAKAGSGTLVLNQANTFSGGLNITEGKVTLGNATAAGTGKININANTLELASAGALTLANIITGTGIINAKPAAVAGANLILSGNLTGFTGVVNVATSGGFSSKLATTTAGQSIFGAGTILNVASGGTWYTTVSQSGTTVNLFGMGNSENLGALRLDSGAILDSTSSVILKSNASIGSTGSGTLNAVISEEGGSFSLTKQGAGTITLSGESTYSGGTSINGGLINVMSDNAFGTGAVAFNGGIRLTIATGLDVTNSITIGSNAGVVGYGLIEAGTTPGTAILSGPITINNNAAAGGHFAARTAGAILHLKGPITVSMANKQISQRDGTVMFSGGGTGYTNFVLTGTTIVGAPNGIATTATVMIGASNPGTLDLNGFDQSLAGIAKNPSYASTITNRSTTTAVMLTLTGTSSYAGVIRDGGGDGKINLAVNGGSLTLSGANTYSGATTISAGTLALGANNVLPNTTPVSIGAGTLNADVRTDTVGPLGVTAGAAINLGAGAALAFADSSSTPWAGTLNITGTFVSGASLRFGTTSSGLTAGQLAAISSLGCSNFGLDSNGYLTATTTPAISATGTLAALNTTYGTASSTTSFTVSGAYLTGAPGNLTVAPPSGYEVSLSSGSGYSTSLSVPYSSATLASTTVYVRLTATAGAASYSGDISVSGGGAIAQTIPTVSSTVNPKALTIGAPTVTKVYNGLTTAGTLTIGTLTGFVGSETVTATGTATAYSAKDVGSAYACTVSYVLENGTGGGLAANYTLADSVIANAAITPALLTVTADNKRRAVGEANPAFTYTITGYQNGEDATSASVTGAPSVTTTADTASPAGTYTLTCEANNLAAPNYTFGYVNGTLTVYSKGTMIQFLN